MEQLLAQSGRPKYSAARDAEVKEATTMIAEAVGLVINAKEFDDIGKKRRLKDFKYTLQNGQELSIEVEVKKTSAVVVDGDGFPVGGAHVVGKKRIMDADLLVQYIPKSQVVWITDKNTLLNAPSTRKNTTYAGQSFTQSEEFLQVSKESTDIYRLEDRKLVPVSGLCNHGYLNENKQPQSQSQSIAG